MLGHKTINIQNEIKAGMHPMEATLHDLVLTVNLDIKDYQGDINFSLLQLVNTEGLGMILDVITTEGNLTEEGYVLEMHFETDLETLEGFVDEKHGHFLDPSFDLAKYLKDTVSVEYVVEDTDHLDATAFGKIRSASLAHPEFEGTVNVNITEEVVHASSLSSY